MKTGLLAGDADILTVVNDDSVSDIAVVVFDRQIVDAFGTFDRGDRSDGIPGMLVLSNLPMMDGQPHFNHVAVALVDDPSFDYLLFRSLIKVHSSRVAQRFGKLSDAVRKFFADGGQSVGGFFELISIRIHQTVKKRLSVFNGHAVYPAGQCFSVGILAKVRAEPSGEGLRVLLCLYAGAGIFNGDMFDNILNSRKESVCFISALAYDNNAPGLTGRSA